MLIVIGPLFLSHTSINFSRNLSEFVVFGSYAQRDDADACGSACDLDVAVNQYAKILHYTLTFAANPDVGFYFQNEATRLLTMGEKSEDSVHLSELLSGL